MVCCLCCDPELLSTGIERQSATAIPVTLLHRLSNTESNKPSSQL